MRKQTYYLHEILSLDSTIVELMDYQHRSRIAARLCAFFELFTTKWLIQGGTRDEKNTYEV